MTHTKKWIMEMAEYHMDEQEREIDLGEENKTVRLVRKAMAPLVDELDARLTKAESDIKDTIHSIDNRLTRIEAAVEWRNMRDQS